MKRFINSGAFLAYFILFGLIFKQFIVNNTLPGNCDTYLWLSLWNAMGNQIAAFFTGAEITTSMYPVSKIFAYGEASFANGLIFNTIKLIFRGDVGSYYVWLTLTFALNAFSVYYLTSTITRIPYVKWLAGLFFACSNFLFANIDTSVALSFYPAIFALYALIRSMQTGKKSLFFLSSVFMASSVYFSLYVFLIFLLPYFLIMLGNFIRLYMHFKKNMLAHFLILVLCVLPFFFYYTPVKLEGNFSSPTPIEMPLRFTSLQLEDWFQVLPGNQLYPSWSLKSNKGGWWSLIRRSAFLGFTLWITGFIGLCLILIKYRNNWYWVLIAFFGVVLSTRLNFAINDNQIPDVLGFLYSNIPIFGHFRIPLRAFVLVLLALVIGSVWFIEYLSKRFPIILSFIVIPSLLIVYLAENIPFPMPSYTYQSPPETMINYFNDKNDNIVLHLPSYNFISMQFDDQIYFEYSREAIYMNFQSYHKQNILNGVNGYIPTSRTELQYSIIKIPQEIAFKEMGDNAPDYIVYHHDLELPTNKSKIIYYLKRSKLLEQVASSKRCTIFRMKNKQSEN